MAPLPPYPGSARLTARPITPENRMSRRGRGRGRGRNARRRLLFWCLLRQWMQDSADTTRFFGGDAMSLTVEAHGTRATVSDPSGIEHTHRPIVFGASFLRIERGPLLTTQCAIRLG